MAVETRKWRLGLVWLFHAWEQIPRDLAKILKAADPHYHLYTTRKRTYRSLEEEMLALTVDNRLRTPRHGAVNITPAVTKSKCFRNV